MPPLPPESTPRFRVNYSVNGFEHDFQLRSSASPSAIGGLIDSFLTALGQAVNVIIIGTVEFAADESNVFLPVTTGIEGNVYGEASQTNPNANNFYGFVGRSAAGRKWKLQVYGARTLGIDFRMQPGEDARIDAAIAVLNGATPAVLGIDNTAVTVYNYANTGVNAHWQRAVRQ